MATVSFEISTAYLTRMRAAIVAEQPALQGQTNAVINEAARVRVRQMVRDWVRAYETNAAMSTAATGVQPGTDADIL